ncbi:MAG: metallopeptidase [Lachnospiraceae bacterium]|nr:metallopeptidase [Lachnospiraceae bacterium]
MAEQTQWEWQLEIADEILSLIRSELYLDFRFMDVALSALSWKPAEGIDTFGTDGEFLYYSMERLLQVYPVNSAFLNRLYLHSILHCIFSHLWLCGNRQRPMWDLACDVMVEYTIDHMDKPSTRRVLSLLRKDLYNRLEKQQMGISAAVIYQSLLDISSEEFQTLQQEFYTDTHKYWPESKQMEMAPKVIQKRWEQIGRQTQMEMEQRGADQTEGQELMEQEMQAGRSRRGYRDFLRKFTVLREEMHLDPEEYDLNYYSYGLRLYGNMPLLEPMETREIQKIQEFVIVVDTSYSTSGDLVKAFLQETFDILMEKEHFFIDSRIHVIQCDDQVQTDQLITNEQELEKLLQSFTIVGGGGTDFRPAFTYVNQLRENGELKHLRGMLYFTDGKGVYPQKRPDYQTAFLFLGGCEETAVPPWAMRLRIMPEELQRETSRQKGNVYS